MEHAHQDDARIRLTLFEERYGIGAYDELIALLRQPCITFAQVGTRFGVTRECVRQWHSDVLPDAPKGRERRGLCQLQQTRRRLLTDPLFRVFYQAAALPLRHRAMKTHPARRAACPDINGAKLFRYARYFESVESTKAVPAGSTCRRRKRIRTAPRPI